MPVESRLLRYFAAVAERRSFARAAEQLGIAAPALSRAVRALEAELGVTLLHRTTRAVSLTEAGSELLEDITPALEALEAATRRARRAAAPSRSVLLAVKADTDGGLLEDILDATAAEEGAAPVAVRLCGWGEHAGLVRSGEVDAALVYEPYDHRGLDAETILTEPRVAALPADHPLAARATVALAELDISAGELDRRAERDFDTYQATDLAQLLTLIALGTATTVLPRSVAARYPRPGISYVPIGDAPLAALTIAWHEHAHAKSIAALVRAAVASGSRRGEPAYRWTLHGHRRARRRTGE
jgi:DNA-binding transcriptional LysR family regulator